MNEESVVLLTDMLFLYAVTLRDVKYQILNFSFKRSNSFRMLDPETAGQNIFRNINDCVLNDTK